jgi:glycosyltransferase involved in cell wall biosynthesis
MYCGGCFRDNALVTALRSKGHEALMVPLYLPLTLDEPDQSAGMPIFYGGINVYLDQKSTLFRKAPVWLHQLLSSRPLLHWAAGRAAKTRPDQAGDLLLSMLQGEEGNQARELDDLIAWLHTQPKPDAICLSNALLAGMARRLKSELRLPVSCLLGGEDYFLDGLPVSVRAQGWKTLADRCRDVDLFLPPTQYFAELMSRRIGLAPSRMRIVPNGINVTAYPSQPSSSNSPPTLGYFARMCREKGLDLLVDVYLLLKKRETTRQLRLHIGGGCGPGDEPFVQQQRSKLAKAGVNGDVTFFPNVDHAGKVSFLRGLDVFCTPAHYGEAFGLYVIEALAAGVPVVQPRTAAFPELVEATGGGLLAEPNNPTALADAIEGLLKDPAQARRLGEHGRQSVTQRFTHDHMAEAFVSALQTLPGVAR